jgi:putative thioredoxin
MIDFNKDVIEASKKELIILDFYADWCGPCKMLGPILEKLAEEYKVKLIKLNVDQEQELAQEFGIMSIPTVVFFKGGEPKDFFTGAYPEKNIREFIEKNK